MTKARWAAAWRPWPGRVWHALGVTGRHLLAGLYMQGTWMYDLRAAMWMCDWLNNEVHGSAGTPQPAPPENPARPRTPPGHLERLIPEVPLTPRERELWADLLDRQPRRSGHGKYLASTDETEPTPLRKTRPALAVLGPGQDGLGPQPH